MADVNGYATYMLADTGFGALSSLTGTNTPLTPSVTYFFQMEGFDASTTSKTTWVVQGAADIAATTPQAVAAIALAGLTTPLRLVRVVSTWPAP